MPLFKVWWPDRGQDQEDGRTVNAFDAEGAAGKWADWYDHHSNDYAIVGGEAAEVKVCEEGTTQAVSVTVYGEMTRSYRARAAKQEEHHGKA